MSEKETKSTPAPAPKPQHIPTPTRDEIFSERIEKGHNTVPVIPREGGGKDKK
jgi:hypothetical protein